jgi:hypothetical protein
MNHKFSFIIIIIFIITIIYIYCNFYYFKNKETFSCEQKVLIPPETEAIEQPKLENLPYNNKAGRRLRRGKEEKVDRDILYKCQKTAFPCGNNLPAGNNGKCTTNKDNDKDFNNCDKAFGTVGNNPDLNYGFWSPDDGKCYSECYDPSGNLI